MSESRTTRSPPRLVVAVWAAACLGGLAWLADYGLQADPGGPPLTPWPADIALELAPDRPTLVMTAHPQCPCTRASLEVLARIRAQAGDRLRWIVLFAQIEGVELRSDTWRQAGAIPGVEVIADPDGRLAGRLGAVSSGQTYVYNPDGELLYSGGLTASRGHAGDNAGQAAVLAIARGGRSETVGPPAFGCALGDRSVRSGDD